MHSKILKTLKVLLVEDEKKLAMLLKNAIGDSFLSFNICSNGEEGLQAYKQLSPDIIITDIMMPIKDGLAMAQDIRSINTDIPIIILSAISETNKLLHAIDIGVVKYFIKPFDPDELLEYIISLSDKFEIQHITLVDDFIFHNTKKVLYKKTRYIPLSKKENKFIIYMIENDCIVHYDTIKTYLWDDQNISDTRLRTFIKRVRQKTSKNLIMNFTGLGYKINILTK
jgi:DNA-binding response OmpR family regulator